MYAEEMYRLGTNRSRDPQICLNMETKEKPRLGQKMYLISVSEIPMYRHRNQ